MIVPPHGSRDVIPEDDDDQMGMYLSPPPPPMVVLPCKSRDVIPDDNHDKMNMYLWDPEDEDLEEDGPLPLDDETEQEVGDLAQFFADLTTT